MNFECSKLIKHHQIVDVIKINYSGKSLWSGTMMEKTNLKSFYREERMRDDEGL